jgi:hypothetical protein
VPNITGVPCQTLQRKHHTAAWHLDVCPRFGVKKSYRRMT